MKKMIFALLFTFASAAFGVDINTADENELATVKGIGPAKAKAIVDYRKKNGPFKSVDDLTNVKGFDPKTISNVKGELTAGSGAKKGDAKTDPAPSSKADETMSKDAPGTYQDKKDKK
jgi:competence protein ComEA